MAEGLYRYLHSLVHLPPDVGEDLQQRQILWTDIIAAHHADTAKDTIIRGDQFEPLLLPRSSRGSTMKRPIR